MPADPKQRLRSLVPKQAVSRGLPPASPRGPIVAKRKSGKRAAVDLNEELATYWSSDGLYVITCIKLGDLR